ncbi:MAG: divalent-cation tolerance protein CutA [Desulfopila sp.]|jgi:periplasmic divalent cation tolerance protein|nr:divalent-cation tolerance protein CutA [Desulfopila sp.]
MKKLIVVQTTFTKREEAVDMAVNAVRKRLAACAQLSGEVESFYWWKDTIEHSPEFILRLKTTEDAYPILEEFIRNTHSYETPEIIGVSVDRVDADYLQWLEGEIHNDEK